jgi:CheY-like chemotaxis protein
VVLAGTMPPIRVNDALVRKMAIKQIASLGYSTIEAETPAEALDAIAGSEPLDLLFSDIVMPGPIDGVRLAQLAREKRPNLKVLLTSGYPDLKTGRSSENGFEEEKVLKKPYRRTDLQNALHEILDSR